MLLNYFETQIAMVEAGAGAAVLPTFCIPLSLTSCIAERAEPWAARGRPDSYSILEYSSLSPRSL